MRISLYIIITFNLFVHTAHSQSDLWVTAYYAGWSQGWFNNGVLPAEDIDYSAVTHIIHFGLVPKSSGALDSDANSIRPSNSSELITRAHAAGKKVLISVGGWGTDASFRGATNLLKLPGFIENLATFMTSRGYDGIDIDWEVLEVTDAAQYVFFIKQLRARLNQISPRPLLTAAVVWQPAVFAVLAEHFDQINIMTYDMSGAWPGWVSWHNAPVVSSGLRFPSNGRLIPSAETMVNDFVAAGVPAKKIGIGIDFYGYIWNGGNGTPTGGITGPRQSWTSSPSIQVNVPFYSLIPTYYQPHVFQWDSLAQSPYLSIDEPGATNDKFVTYDNEMSCQRKVEFANNKGIGGVFIWELGGGQLPSDYPVRDRLLQAIKNAHQQTNVVPPAPGLTAPLANIVGINTNPTLTWLPSEGASSYWLQVARDSAFTSPVFDQNWIIWNSQQIPSLITNTTYFWRVRGASPTAVSGWSQQSSFTTMVHPSLPLNWAFFSQTGSSATITIPALVTPTIGPNPLMSGDAIGVFFDQYAAGTCSGYGVWEEGKEFTLTIWGDDPSTLSKDGLAEGDTLRFRVWSTRTRREYIALAVYETGGPTYTKDSSYALSSLVGSPLIRQTITLSRGENTVSSFLAPTDGTLENMVASIKPRVLAIRDGTDGLFRPDSNINTIVTWDVRQAYKIHMLAADSLIISGTEISPDTVPIPLNHGWNLAAYLRNAPMRVDSALGSILNSLLIVKDNSGNVYWPAVGINTIGTISPGQGYQVFVRQPTTLDYPQNISPTAAIKQSMMPTRIADQRDEAHSTATGPSATLLIEASDLEDGDEVRVRTSAMPVGSGVARQGKALLTLWGDNSLTSSALEGARESEQLIVTVWSASRRKELPLLFESITDALTNNPVESPLRYNTDGVWIAHTRRVATTLVLEQNYPNPFNATTTIRYALPADVRVQLEIFDVLGRVVMVLVDQEQKAGYYDVRFESSKLPSGVYFYRLTTRAIPQSSSRDGFGGGVQPLLWTATRKLIIMK